MDIMTTFYDKTADIYSINITNKRWSNVKQKKLLYNKIKCDYYIATRWNVVNFQSSLWEREQDLDRIDMVVPWINYDITKPILQWMFVVLGDNTEYIIDAIEYYRFPDWTLESIFIRLNQKWD